MRSLAKLSREVIVAESLSSFAGKFTKLRPDEQVRFLAYFAQMITIASRDSHEHGDDGGARRLRQWNELQHRILGNLTAMMVNSSERYPDSVLAKIAYAAATEDGLGEPLFWAWDRAAEWAKRNVKPGGPSGRHEKLVSTKH
jgi:hypothetical protein